MNLAEGVLAFAAIVTVAGLGGLAFMYRLLRRPDGGRELPKL